MISEYYAHTENRREVWFCKKFFKKTRWISRNIPHGLRERQPVNKRGRGSFELSFCVLSCTIDCASQVGFCSLEMAHFHFAAALALAASRALILATSLSTKPMGFFSAGFGAAFGYPPNFTKASWEREVGSASDLGSRASRSMAWVVTARKATVAKKALSILRFVVVFCFDYNLRNLPAFKPFVRLEIRINFNKKPAKTTIIKFINNSKLL